MLQVRVLPLSQNINKTKQIKMFSIRNKAKQIVINAINKEISETEAEQQLSDLFGNIFTRIDEKNLQPVGKKRKYKLYELDGNRCFYCNIETYKVQNNVRMYNHSTIDHLLPKSKGGIDFIENCVIACPGCNELKASDILPKQLKK